ncbi:MAG: hypothetical protein HOH95_11835 [Dehalococcoidia bacterium]|jgi:hypothetical protein|nr:hypothetical protein [Dehalococcoidia bacterium]
MNTYRVLSVFVAIAVLLVASPSSPAAAADRPTSDGPDHLALQAANGDLSWSFSRRNIFADERVTTAFAILVDEVEVVTAAGISGVQLSYADDGINVAAEGQSAEHALLLLAASGVAPPGRGPIFVQSRPCRIWVPAEAASAETDAVAFALSAALVSALAVIEIPIDPCETASSAADADIFLSTAELVVEDPSFLVTDAESFLVFRGGLIDPDDPGTGGEPVPAPAAGGNAGLASAEGGSTAVKLLMLALTGLALFGGRWATRRPQD